jgi:hypothetical protein
MSGVLKSIGKIFTKVIKVVKKVLPYALAIGAAVVTGGAALGVFAAGSWAAGGLAGIASGALGSIGGTAFAASKLGMILSSAAVTAGYGAMVGGATAALTGGKIGKGILRGAAIGGLTGGVAGAITGGGGLLGATTAAQKVAALDGAPAVGTGGFYAGTPAQVAATAPLGTAAPGTVAAGAGAGGGLFGMSPTNALTAATLAGPVISGIGQGVGNYAQAKSQEDMAQAERDRVTDNYSTGGNSLLVPGATGKGLLNQPQPYAGFTPTNTGAGFPTPAKRFSDEYGAGRWVFDSVQGKIVFQPNTPAAPMNFANTPFGAG